MTDEQKTTSTAPSGALNIPKFDFKSLDFSGAFNFLIRIFKLDKAAIEEVAQKESLNAVALIFLVAGVIAGPLGYLIFGASAFGIVVRPSIAFTLVSMVLGVVSSAAGIYIVTYVAVNYFQGKANLGQYFRVMGVISVVGVLNLVGYAVGIFSLISMVVGIWTLVVEYVTLQTVFKMDQKNTVLTILVSIAFMIVFGIIVGAVTAPLMVSTSVSNVGYYLNR